MTQTGLSFSSSGTASLKARKCNLLTCSSLGVDLLETSCALKMAKLLSGFCLSEGLEVRLTVECRAVGKQVCGSVANS